MVKKLLSIVMLVLVCASTNVHGQGMMPKMPLNPKVKAGVLDNGLSYYILENKEPKERANFYIAQKVGSSLEKENQLGLAHFLEHMAFNGTTNYPGKNLLNYLQSKGIRFGADINAYTGIDETVYNINNVPTTDKNLMDSVLIALHDWSCDILLEDSEIEAERGVIQEEWRSGNNYARRRYAKILPAIYTDYQYQHLPIGTMDVVMNFKPEVLKAYYKEWYRPDLQGIIVVGDFDAVEMEKKVKEIFSTIPMPEIVSERIFAPVEDNIAPIYVSFSDPEMTRPLTTISFKKEATPFEERAEIMYYLETNLIQPIVTNLFDNRLYDYSQTQGCNYSSSGVYFDTYYISKTKDSFNIDVVSKGNTQAAVAEAMGVVARACKTGFNYSELERVKNDLLAEYEKAFNERDKTDNEVLGRELCDHFLNYNPSPGIETEYVMMQNLLPNIGVEDINEYIADLLTNDNMVVVTSEPQADGFAIVEESVLISTVQNAMAAEYEPLEEEKITEPLISKLPAPGKVIETAKDENLGITTYTLSNGVKVIVKPTDFSADEIMMLAFSRGGRELYATSQAADVLMMGTVFNTAKTGPFDSNTLDKYLAGKKVGVNFAAGPFYNQISGQSTVKDFPTFMELLYASFTELSPDEDNYKVRIEKNRAALINAEKNPQQIFARKLTAMEYNNNPLLQNPTVETLDNANYAATFKLVENVIDNAAEFTFLFVGNIDEKTAVPLFEQYLATLPAGEVIPLDIVTPIQFGKGQLKEEFKQQMQTPSTLVYNLYTGYNVPLDIKNSVMIDMVGDILSNRLLDTLREEEGGSYSPQAIGQYFIDLNMWIVLSAFSTNAEQQAKMIALAQEQFDNLRNNGADEVNFNKVKEAAVKQYEIMVRNNQYWLSALKDYLTGHDLITGYAEILNSITLEDLNNFMKTMYNGENHIQLVMEGIE